jgi:hypothetical protein
MSSVAIDTVNLFKRRQGFDPGKADHAGWRMQNLTTTQRDALTGEGAAAKGDFIYNTTTNGFEGYNGSGWDPVGGTSGENGTITTSATTTAEERGDDVWHTTKLTLTAFAVGTSGDNASLGIGAKFYSFPAGTIEVTAATMVGGLTAAISNTAQTPEVGIGTVIASGAVAVLSGTATFEDVIDGNTSTTGGDTVAPDVAGTAFYKGGGARLPVLIKTTGGKSRDLFLNCAVAWADVTAAGAVTFTGTISLVWRKVT